MDNFTQVETDEKYSFSVPRVTYGGCSMLNKAIYDPHHTHIDLVRPGSAPAGTRPPTHKQDPLCPCGIREFGQGQDPGLNPGPPPASHIQPQSQSHAAGPGPQPTVCNTGPPRRRIAGPLTLDAHHNTAPRGHHSAAPPQDLDLEYPALPMHWPRRWPHLAPTASRPGSSWIRKKQARITDRSGKRHISPQGQS